MDFSLILMLLFGVSGLILVTDAALFRRRRRAASKTRESLPIQYARSVFPVILIVLVLRSFVMEPFRIPSASMMPGLVDGDFIFVNKFAYGLRLPLLNSKFFSIGQPQRGDVVVFRLPADPSIHYVKRLIGLPGPGEYFLMGDNRNDSEDSRFAQVGFVPDRNLDGRAVLIWMNWKIPGWPNWRRFGTKIT